VILWLVSSVLKKVVQDCLEHDTRVNVTDADIVKEVVDVAFC
jgi:hypothetical protein